jgi:hypothetical protein
MIMFRFIGLALPITELTGLPVIHRVFVFLSTYYVMKVECGEIYKQLHMYLVLLFVAVMCTLLFPLHEIPVRPDVQDCCNIAAARTSPFRSSQV